MYIRVFLIVSGLLPLNDQCPRCVDPLSYYREGLQLQQVNVSVPLNELTG